jgi:hypothetical protein
MTVDLEGRDLMVAGPRPLQVHDVRASLKLGAAPPPLGPFIPSTLERRFLDTGMTNPSTGCGGRRPKSAKARNRGRCAGRGCRGRYGDFAAGSGFLRLD